jgi:hypothetical protein
MKRVKESFFEDALDVETGDAGISKIIPAVNTVFFRPGELSFVIQ